MTDIGGDVVDVVYAGPPGDAERVADRLERRRDGFAVEPTTSSEAVLSAVEGGVECVVAADRVADAGAIDLLRAVRERDADLPVVLVPAAGDESLAADAVAAGATDYLPREEGSVPVERLVDRVESAVETYRDARRRRRERDFLERLQGTIADSTVVVDREGRVVWANERARRRLGVDEEGATVGDAAMYDEDGEFVPPDERPYVEVLTTGEPLEDVRFQIELDDERRWLSINAEPVELDGRRYVAISFEDVTERVRYRRRLEDTRQELATELSEVFERVSDAFFALDEEWRFTYVNETAEELLEVESDAVVGESIWDEFEAAVDTAFYDRYREAMERQQPVTFEEHYEPLSTWFEVRAYPSETGLSVYFRDVTDRKERERALQESRNRLRTLVDHFPNGAVALVDADLRYQVVGGEAFEAMDVATADLEGGPVEAALPADAAEVVVPRYEAALDGEPSEFTLEYGGEVREFRAVPVRDDDGEVQAALAISQDVTERREHERRLRALHDASRDLFRAESADGVNRSVVRAVRRALDVSGAAVYERDAAADELVPAAGSGAGLLDDEDLPALPVDDGSLVGHAFVDGETKLYDDVRDSDHLYADPEATPVRSALLVPFAGEDVLVVGSGEVGAYGERTRQLVETVAANAAVAHERVARERELETRASQQAAVTDLGRRALADRPLDELFEEAADLVADRLGVDFSKVLDYRPGEGELLLRAGAGWEEGYVGEETVPDDRGSHAGFVLESREPVVVEDVAAEDRFEPEPLLTDHGVKSGVSVVVGSVDDPWGVLGAHHGDERPFSEDDVNFVQGVANVLASTVENRLRRRDRRETAEVFRELYGVAADDELTFDQQLDRLLDLGREYLGLDAGFMTRIEDGEQTFAAVRGGVDLQEGATCPLSETYCRGTLSADELRAVPDAATDDRVGDAAHERWSFDAYIGAPVTVRGEQYGTLCFVAEAGREQPFDDTMETFVELAAQWVSFELGRQQRQWELERTERQFEAAFDNPHSFMAVLDPDGSVRRVNDVALAFAGVDNETVRGEPLSETPWFAHSASVRDRVRTGVAAAADGESVRDEVEHVGADGERKVLDTLLEPVSDEDGEVVALFASGRDVTDREERDEALRAAYEVFVDGELTLSEKIDALLELGRETVGTDYATLSRVEDDTYVFESVAAPPDADLAAGDTTDLSATNCERAIETGEHLVLPDVEAEAPALADRAGNAEWGISAYVGTPLTVGDDDYGTFCFYDVEPRESFADWKVTFVDLLGNWIQHELERRRRQQELERTERQFEAAFDNPHSFMAILDPDGTVRQVNDVALEFAGLDEDDVVGEPFPETPWWDHSPALQHSLRGWIDRAADGEYVRFEEDHVVGDDRATVDGVLHPVTDDDGEVVAIFATGRDVSERKEQERRLRKRIRQQEVVTDLGRRALETSDVDALMADAAERVAETLDTDYCTVLDLDADAGELLLREGVGWDEGYVGEATVPAGDDDSQAAYVLSSDDPVVVEDLDAETRFGGPDLLTDHGVASGISVVVGPSDDPWGILGTHDADRREFSEQDVNFVRSVATILANAIARHRDERELRRQRERLDALNDLNSLAQRIGEAVVQQSSREEIERLVCEALSESDAYEFAWLGELDEERGEVVDRVQAGDAEYVDQLAIDVEDDPDRRGPTATAVRTGEMQVVEDVLEDPEYEPWRELATDHGYRSSVAVPVRYEDSQYGVLNVYSDRPDAFGAAERETFGRLGTIVAHAIRSVERERELRESERRYRTMAENVPNGSVTLVDEDLRYQLVAGRTYEEIDLDPAEMEGRRVPEVEAIPADVRAEVSDIMRRVLDGEEVSTEVEYRDRTYAYHAIPLSTDGEVHAAMSLSQDITERVRRERELEHERERLELLNRLIRHNLLNSLNVVDARLSLVEGHVDYEVSDHLETAADRTGEMIDLIRTIRALMRAISDDEQRDLEPLSVGELLGEEVDDAARAFPDAAFETGTLPDVEVLADELLTEVFENLLVNAVQHNDKDQPRVWVDTRAADDAVVVEVADNGPGVPEELREAIFDKGTKGFESPGTGFGLHLVREIVDAYDGDVSVSNVDASELPASFESGGARFRVELPRA